MYVYMSPARVNALAKLAEGALTRKQLRDYRISAGIVQALIDENFVSVLRRDGDTVFCVTCAGLKQLEVRKLTTSAART
jgi:hypothetical protein